MHKVIRHKGLPPSSFVAENFGHISYADCYKVVCPLEGNARKIAADFFTLPRPVRFLMQLRDTLVKPFGLKTSDDFVPEDAPAGEPTLFFHVYKETESEVVMGETDSHLDFRASILVDKENSCLYVTTLVQYRNTLGILYFNLIRPFHAIIIRSGLKRFCKKQNSLLTKSSV